MKNIYIILFIFLFLTCKSYASHIVGGEITLEHLGNFRYDVVMTLYFDVVNGNPGAEDEEVTLYFWEKNSGNMVQSAVLPRYFSSAVEYTQPECVDARLRTKKIIYRLEVYLAPDIFSDQDGYYVTWSRCCRNYVIDNIYSSDPEFGGIGSGQTFYTEFPPVVDSNGNPFVNSTPAGFSPLRDYACVNRYFETDFSGFDRDGDSIAYSLVHPLSVIEPVPLPPPSPGPYPRVVFKNGFSPDNMIPGNPKLSITNRTGKLFVNPSYTGLFVFAVKAEEFRNGKKIGEVRRDFQMLIIDCPAQGNKPRLTVNDPNSNIITDNDIEVVFSDNEATCLNLFVQDEDGGENVSIKAIPVNFNASDLNNQFTITNGFLGNGQDTLKTSICLPDCPYTVDKPMIIDIVALDDACPQPLTDTLRISITVESTSNTAPDLDIDFTEIEISPGEELILPFFAIDFDGDSIYATLLGNNPRNNNQTLGFGYQSQFDQLYGSLSWSPQCSDLNPDLSPVSFDVQVLVRDTDECFPKFDTATVSITLADDYSDFDGYQPPNVITANSDGINDTFNDCQGGDCDQSFILPPDNCANRFEMITIVNRWGQKVYESKSRNFSWDGSDLASGVYFYEIMYTNRSYKGHISLLRGD
ncbi:T9SS type B sorting domain-containing protein [Marinigracilibium pacificum]|uniref:Gliding motility-associated-like protein n=1 Tax=Marinigracilibium pacificum TaxID=2729599 RepID=A0A848J734_9BACT|nr:gliding motility-associated C-terminal domain-containing protein [Marinigracilibium pacificum]NMM48922.1 hypothetical protein [Marinigracilibium pacificum]